MNTRGGHAHSKLSDLHLQTIRLWAAEGQDENGAEVNGPTVELSLSISQFEDYVFDVESGFYSHRFFSEMGLQNDFGGRSSTNDSTSGLVSLRQVPGIDILRRDDVCMEQWDERLGFQLGMRGAVGRSRE